jgi:hypothetical protein
VVTELCGQVWDHNVHLPTSRVQEHIVSDDQRGEPVELVRDCVLSEQI